MDERLYALQDDQFNVTAITDSSGNVKERYSYSPYGTRTILNPDFTTAVASSYDWNIAHQGLMLDTESGLIYNRHRYLHPGLGRFLTRDPLRYVDGMNFYEYQLSSPTNYFDPSGRTAAASSPFTGWAMQAENDTGGGGGVPWIEAGIFGMQAAGFVDEQFGISQSLEDAWNSSLSNPQSSAWSDFEQGMMSDLNGLEQGLNNDWNTLQQALKGVKNFFGRSYDNAGKPPGAAGQPPQKPDVERPPNIQPIDIEPLDPDLDPGYPDSSAYPSDGPGGFDDTPGGPGDWGGQGPGGNDFNRFQQPDRGYNFGDGTSWWEWN